MNDIFTISLSDYPPEKWDKALDLVREVNAALAAYRELKTTNNTLTQGEK